jgi:hypothetical protein
MFLLDSGKKIFIYPVLSYCLPLLIFVFSCAPEVEIPDEILALGEEIPERPDYNFHIKPIISDRCFKCHGPDRNKVEAGLQLTSRDASTIQLESGRTAIVPGKINRSELVRRILSPDPDERMPPPESHLTLTDAEKAMLIRWIEQGAEYKPHWSLKKIEKSQVATVGQSWFARLGITADEETEWVSGDIDRFTLARMKEHGLKPAPAADKNTLLRRVSMDLTGLPPTPSEVQAFLTDKSQNAYEKAVDRLLASPHFGEHQAVSWLDLARYADTHGYQDDGMRNVYPYRDWVIHAFNSNLPFDKFVTYQLAGDLLPDPSKDMLIATSFNRQHPQSQEGGIVPEEYHSEYVADRTNTFGKAFLGLTMECARCHDHKYDPISARDYYSLSAFFNQNKDFGEVPYNGEAAPTVMLPEPDVEKKINFIRNKISAASAKLDENQKYERNFNAFMDAVATDNVDEGILSKDLQVHLDFDRYEKDAFSNGSPAGIKALLSGDWDRRPLIVDGKFGKAIQLQGDCGIQLISREDENAKQTSDRFYKGLNLEKNHPFSVSFWIKVVRDKTSGPVITRNNGEFEGFRGYDILLNPDRTLSVRMMYVYPANGIEYRTTEKIGLNAWTHLALTYDGSAKAQGLKLFVDGKFAQTKLLTDNLTKSILHGEKKSNWNFMPFEIGKDFRSTIEDIQVDEFRFYSRRISSLEVRALQVGSKSVSLDVGRDELFDFYIWNYDQNFRENFDALSKLRLEETVLATDVPEVMIMQELPEDQMRQTFILDRGVYDSPREKVSAETPARIGLLPSDYPRNRLGLAKWLLHEENPLFARVMVNRIWMSFFGNGIVKTQEDFGNQGDLPTHPELLDWLAVTFREDNWDTKKFMKRIVMSSTYRQSSSVPPELLELDPENKWLSRGPSQRLTAEQVRDNALASSGLLVRKIGGPSVYPYQPGGIWEALATRNAVSYEQGKGDDLYRRSLYTVWKRSSPPPMMLNFDAADRQSCTSRRQRTATPLQALVTMNDPQFVESARVMAERALQTESSAEGRVTFLYLCAVSRNPRPSEMQIIRELVAKQAAHFRANRAHAAKLASVGEYSNASGLDPVEVAAYTVAANTILNSDEALVKR